MCLSKKHKNISAAASLKLSQRRDMWKWWQLCFQHSEKARNMKIWKGTQHISLKWKYIFSVISCQCVYSVCAYFQTLILLAHYIMSTCHSDVKHCSFLVAWYVSLLSLSLFSINNIISILKSCITWKRKEKAENDKWKICLWKAWRSPEACLSLVSMMMLVSDAW